MLSRLLTDTLSVSLFVSAVIVVVLLLPNKAAGKYSAALKYWIWLALFVRLVIPFNFTLAGAPVTLVLPAAARASAGGDAHIAPSARVAEDGDPHGDSGTSPVASNLPGPTAGQEQRHDVGFAPDEAVDIGAPGRAISSSNGTAPAAPGEAAPLSPVRIAAFVWLGGAAVSLLIQLSGYAAFLLKLRRIGQDAPSEIGVLLRRLAAELRVKAPRAVICGDVEGPMMAGLLRPVVILPACALAPEALALILRHELSHLKRRDLWFKLLLTLARCLHWFNPVVYLAVKRASLDAELACDEAVLRNASIEDRIQYGQAILQVVRRRAPGHSILSTHFSADGRSLKRRFTGILDTGGKRRGAMLLTLVVAITVALGLLVGCQSAETKAALSPSAAPDTAGSPAFAPGTVYSYSSANVQVLSYDAGNSYSVGDDGKVTVSYNNGETTAAAPLTIRYLNGENYADMPGAFISADKTAFSYGSLDGTTPLVIYLSDDMGKTWYTSELSLPGIGVSRSFIGFNSKNDGWLVVSNFHGMNFEDHYIFKTADGGKTWTKVDGNQDDIDGGIATGAGFSENGTAYLCFWYYVDDGPTIIWSQDGGKTWEKLSLKLPAEYDNYEKTGLSPVFDGPNGTLPVLLSEGGAGGYVGTVYYTTTDNGKTWSFDNTANLARVWAYAWQTRSGKPRYDMMGAALQADFRAQQGNTDSYVIRWSSPWVERYDVALDGGDAIITYWYADSSGMKYKGTERLSFGAENGRTVVTGCKTELELQAYTQSLPLLYTETPLKNEKLPVLNESHVSKVLYTGKAGDGIKQTLYRYDENTVSDVGVFSYIEIGGVKYDLGYVGYTGLDGDVTALGSWALERTELSSAIPVYEFSKSYGAASATRCYYTIKDGIPYFQYEAQGWGQRQTDMDGDGQDETILEYSGGAAFHEIDVYKWDFSAGTVKSVTLTDLLGCDSVDYDANADIWYARNHISTEQNGTATLLGEEGLSYRLKNGVFRLITDGTAEGVKNSFRLAASYDRATGLLSFKIPDKLPEGSRFYLNVSGRLKMGGDGFMSFHAFEEETKSYGWVSGKTYTYQLDASGVDSLLLVFGLVDANGKGRLYDLQITETGLITVVAES